MQVRLLLPFTPQMHRMPHSQCVTDQAAFCHISATICSLFEPEPHNVESREHSIGVRSEAFNLRLGPFQFCSIRSMVRTIGSLTSSVQIEPICVRSPSRIFS